VKFSVRLSSSYVQKSMLEKLHILCTYSLQFGHKSRGHGFFEMLNLWSLGSHRVRLMENCAAPLATSLLPYIVSEMTYTVSSGTLNSSIPSFLMLKQIVQLMCIVV